MSNDNKSNTQKATDKRAENIVKGVIKAYFFPKPEERDAFDTAQIDVVKAILNNDDAALKEASVRYTQNKDDAHSSELYSIDNFIKDVKDNIRIGKKLQNADKDGKGTYSYAR